MGTRNPNNFINIPADALGYMLCRDHVTNDREPVGDTLGLTDPAEADRLIDAQIGRMLDGTAVGAVLLNTNYSMSAIPCETHDVPWRRVNGQTITVKDLENVAHWHRLFVMAHDHGIEPFSIAMKHIRRRGAGVWFSIRMNDFHYLNIPEVCATFRAEHPEYLCDPKGVFDFSFEAVRNYRRDYILELCRRYDVDGIEFDMIRGDRYFPDGGMSDGEKAGMLTEFLCDLRKGIDAVAAEKGRKIETAARIYSDVETDEKRFFRPADWIARGAVDKLILCNFFVPGDFNIDIAGWRDYLRLRGVRDGTYALLAGTDHNVRCVKWGDPAQRSVRLDTALLRGFSSSAFHRGADGLYLFNYFLMEPELDYAAFTTEENALRGARRFVRTYRDPGQDTPMPWTLEEGRPVATLLPTGRKTETAYALLLGLDNGALPSVTVNGTALEAGTLTEAADPEGVPVFAEYRVPAEIVADGDQTIIVSGSGNRLLWLEMTASV